MKSLRFAVAGALVAFVALGTVLVGQEGVLRYRWTKGETIRYRIVQTTNAAMSGIPGMGEMNITNTMTQVQRFIVQDVAADGTATLQSTFEAIKMEMGTPMGTYVYDSASPNQNSGDPVVSQLASSIGAMVGESITIVMSPNGAIQKIDGMSRVMEKVTKTVPAGPLGAGGLDSFMSDESMKGVFGQSFASFPANAVKVGDTWKGELAMPNPFGTMHIASTFTVKGTENTGGKELVRIVSASTIKGTPSDKPSPLPIPMKVEISDGTGQGELLFDRKLGRTQKATADTTVPIAMNMTAPDGTVLNLTALTKTMTTMELIEK